MLNIISFKKYITISTLCLLSSPLFAAGYILPNGTILYDDSMDHAMYRIDHMTQVQSPAKTQTYALEKTTRIVIEDKVVTYDRPVIIKERIIDRGPVYDIVDATGAVIVYGLLYNSMAHGFYHHDVHRGHRYRYDHYRR